MVYYVGPLLAIEYCTQWPFCCFGRSPFLSFDVLGVFCPTEHAQYIEHAFKKWLLRLRRHVLVVGTFPRRNFLTRPLGPMELTLRKS